MSRVRYLSCKIASRAILQKQENLQHLENKMGQMQVESASQSLQIDNLFDMLFDQSGKPKEEHMRDKLVFKDNQFDFLEKEGKNIDTIGMAQKVVDVEKLKLTKQFKLVNPVPKFQSVPATPQFFDLASGFIDYPSLADSVEKHKI
jgi:hypothetical protein